MRRKSRRSDSISPRKNHKQALFVLTRWPLTTYENLIEFDDDFASDEELTILFNHINENNQAEIGADYYETEYEEDDVVSDEVIVENIRRSEIKVVKKK